MILCNVNLRLVYRRMFEPAAFARHTYARAVAVRMRRLLFS